MMYNMKKVITSGINQFKKSNLRKGVLYFDNTTRYETPNTGFGWVGSYTQEFHYYFDTEVHLNFAKLQDAEDWKDYDAIESQSIKNLFEQ